MEIRKFIGNWSLRIGNWTVWMLMGDWIGKAFSGISVSGDTRSRGVSGVKIKTVSVISNFFFKNS
jgi:hypothetical protein